MTTVLSEIEHRKIARDLETNVQWINDMIGIGTSWDMLAKPFEFGRLKMMSYVANGFFLTMNMVLILEDLQRCIVTFEQQKQGTSFTMEELVGYLNTHIAFVQVQPVDKMSDVLRFILSGPMITFIDGFDRALMIDTRIYPMRSISPPLVESVIRGNHDGFTETMLMNTALIRRRLRDPRLRVELMQIGNRSQTDVSLVYLKDVADEKLVSAIREKLKSIESDTMTMGEQQLIDLIGKVKWNPYPIARYTERPDVATTALLEGQVVIVVDTTAEVIIAPTTFFQHLQHPQEYHSYPLVGTYLRWVILFGVFCNIFLPGLFLMANAHPKYVPHWAAFFLASHDPLPLWAEIVLAEVTLDLLRLAVLNTPTALASAVGIVAALLFGQFASKIELMQPEVLVYMGLVMIAQFATPSYELGSANQITRFWIIIWTALLGAIGFAISVVCWLILMICTRSFGVPYFWPLIPFKWKQGLLDVLVRLPFSSIHGIPAVFGPRRKTKV